MKYTASTLLLGLTLALIPATAFAAYIATKMEGTPRVSSIMGEDTVTGETKVIATLIEPQTVFDNLYTDYRIYLSEKNRLTPEEIKRRELLGQKRILEDKLSKL